MENDILISVVMPTYNSESYILKTLDSIFLQTTLPFEIVIVDDGSADHTIDIIRNYMSGNEDANDLICILEQKNAGAGAARNKGIERSRGNWISFIDSDDIWEHSKLKKTIEAILENPKCIIVTHDEYSADESNLNDRRYCPLHINYKEDENLFLQLYKGNLFSTSCMTVQRKVILKAGGFDTSLRSAQDYDLWIRIGKFGNAVFIKEALETYVTRKGNITSNTYRRYECEMKICKKYIKDVYAMVGEKTGKKIIKKRIFMIHKVETYLALKKCQLNVALKILLQLPKELLKK